MLSSSLLSPLPLVRLGTLTSTDSSSARSVKEVRIGGGTLWLEFVDCGVVRDGINAELARDDTRELLSDEDPVI